LWHSPRLMVGYRHLENLNSRTDEPMKKPQKTSPLGLLPAQLVKRNIRFRDAPNQDEVTRVLPHLADTRCVHVVPNIIASDLYSPKRYTQNLIR